ncbi:MAG: glycosyltransferase [Ignavibacteriae bacterium]|nr:glycosyltransferase [Ignavibacteriota bacterium]
MIVYGWVVLAALLLMLAVVLVNVQFFRRIPKAVSGGTPRLSVCIPARNEAARIGACIRSLVAQEYPSFEILVLDDESTDGTADVVRDAAGGHTSVKVLPGKPLPEGWTGKNWACAQLAEQAQGELLLFTDADTTYEPGALRALAAAIHTYRADLLSLIPRQRMETFWERVFMPLLHFVTMCYLPFPLATYTRSTRLAMANGQCMLFRRDSYETLGGHTAVRSAVVDDVWLARAVKEHGGRIRVMDGTGTVSCRMYESLEGIREGFSKNIFEGLGRSFLLATAVVLWNLATGVLPFLLLPLVLFVPAFEDAHTLFLLHVVAALGIRLILTIKFRYSLPHVFTHPLAILLLVSITIRSALASRRGGVVWKGRTYTQAHT